MLRSESRGGRRTRISRGVRAAAVLSLFGAGPAVAEEPSLTLEWTAPDGCPGRDDVAARVNALLGQNRGRNPRPSATIRGAVTRTNTGVMLHLETRLSRSTTASAPSPEAMRGERQLAGDTCDEVTAAGALVIALAIDPDSVTGSGEASTPPAEPASTPPTGTAAAQPPAVAGPVVDPDAPSPDDPPPPPVRTAEGVRWFVAAHALLDAGSLPAPAFGVRPSLGLARDRLRAEAGIAYFFPRFGEADTGDGRGADVSLLVGNVRGCYRLVPAVVAVDGCVGAEAGAVMASGEGFARSTSASAPWLAAEAGAGASVQVSTRVSLALSAGFLLPFGRSTVRFASDDADGELFEQIHRPSAAAFRASAGLSLSFR